MTSRNLKRLAASGGTAALVLAGMLFLGSGLTSRARSEGVGSHNGLEGTWLLDVTVRACQTGEECSTQCAVARPTFPALFTFAKGGTLTLTTAGQPPALTTPGLGVWQKTGDHTYSAVSEAFFFSPAGAWIQTHRLKRAIEIGDNADQFTDIVNLEIFDTTKPPNLIATGCATSVASRLE